MRKRWIALVFLAAPAAGPTWYVLRPGHQAPIHTRIPELLALLDKTQQDTEQAVAAYQPKVQGRLDDLTVDAVALLKQLPGVEKVEVLVPVEKPKARIVHLADYRFVPKDLYDIAMEQTHKRKLTDAERDELYREFLLQVEIVQTQQIGLLRCLARHHGLKMVYQEGLTKEGMDDYRQRIEELRKLEAEAKELRQQLQDVRTVMKTAQGERLEKAKKIEGEILAMLDQQRPIVLEFGASGRLLVAKEIAVLPLDDAKLLEEAKPIKGGKVAFDERKVKARQQAIVRNVLSAGSFGLVVLGGSHDLSAVVPSGREYIKVWLKGWPGRYKE
jgi:hypothetical protein